jgi:hypothetical protein
VSIQKLPLKSVQLHIEGIGPVLLEKSAKAKYMRISIRPMKGIRVSLPLRGSFDKAEAFVLEKADWIKHHQLKMEKQETGLTVFTGDSEFHTFSHKLVLLPHAEKTLKSRLGHGLLEIRYPDFKTVTEPVVQDYIRFAIEEAYRVEAKKYLPARVAFWAAKYSLNFEKVTIKKAGTRWGSCSHTNNINLNLHLMRLPEALRDYVILHELAHTIEKNHKIGFWRLLEKICPGSKQLDKQMKSYRIGIF